MIKQYSDFSDTELDTLVALVQDWVKFEPKYKPTRNGGQAMDLVKTFGVGVFLEPKNSPRYPYYHAQIQTKDEYSNGEATTPERAICLAVVASRFDVSECVELLKENE